MQGPMACDYNASTIGDMVVGVHCPQGSRWGAAVFWSWLWLFPSSFPRHAFKIPEKFFTHSWFATVVDGNELCPVYPFQLKQLKYEDP